MIHTEAKQKGHKAFGVKWKCKRIIVNSMFAVNRCNYDFNTKQMVFREYANENRNGSSEQ